MFCHKTDNLRIFPLLTICPVFGGHHIEYKLGDTTFEKGLKKFDNRQLETKYLERGYRTTYKSEFDASYEGSGYIHDCVYNEEYYESGQLKYLQGKDTGYTWHENGQLKFKGYDSGKIEYNEQGIITDRAFHWKEPSVKGWGDLNYSLYVEYYRNGSIKEITFSRDEISKDKKSVAMSIHYYWKWDDKSQLINSPEKWKEELPWKRFKDIKQ